VSAVTLTPVMLFYRSPRIQAGRSKPLQRGDAAARIRDAVRGGSTSGEIPGAVGTAAGKTTPRGLHGLTAEPKGPQGSPPQRGT
jgi:hypothetical protein